MKGEYFEIEKFKIGPTVRFNIHGRISSSTSFQFNDAMNLALRMGQNNMILDMRGVEFLSSLGIRTILSTYKQCAATGGNLQITNPPPHVANVLGMAALDTLLLKE